MLLVLLPTILRAAQPNEGKSLANMYLVKYLVLKTAAVDEVLNGDCTSKLIISLSS